MRQSVLNEAETCPALFAARITGTRGGGGGDRQVLPCKSIEAPGIFPESLSFRAAKNAGMDSDLRMGDYSMFLVMGTLFAVS